MSVKYEMLLVCHLLNRVSEVKLPSDALYQRQLTLNVWVSIGAAESYNVSVSCVGSPCN